MPGVTPTKIGGEFLVNTSTANSQENSTITLLPNGGFVVAWNTSTSLTDSEVRLQVFDAAGVKVGSEMLVANYNARLPSITTLENGNFVVSWQGYDSVSDFNDYAVKARIYSPATGPLGDEFVVNTFVSSSQDVPSVAGLENGGFVVAWRTLDSSQDGDNTAVKAQVYSNGGAKVGAEFLVNTEFLTQQGSPSVAGLDGGGFVITWDTNVRTGNSFDFAVKGQVFDDLGAKQGGEFRVNTNNGGTENGNAVTPLIGGGFVAVWRTDFNLGGDSSGSIRAQLFNSTGGLVGSEFRVNAAGIGLQNEPSVSALANGGFVVAWRSDDVSQDGSLDAIKAQAYDANGLPVGDEFLVNTQAASRQIAPSVIGLTNGNFAISWTTQDTTQDGSSLAIKAQLFSTGTPVNTLPAGTDAAITMDEDTSRTLTVADFGFTDADAGDVLVGVTIATLPGAGTLTLGGAAVTALSKVSFAELNAGLLVFTPTANAFGTGYTSFNFQVEDQNGGVDASANTLTFNVTDVAEPDPYNGVTIIGTIGKDTISPTRTVTGQPKATAQNDKLYGFDGDDSLDGGGGGDLLTGGNGNDKYTIDNANDVVVELAGAAAGTKDLMQSSAVSFTLAANVENGTLLGSAALGITGNELENQLTGNTGNNSLYGMAGKDKLSGKAGVDHLFGGTESDTLAGDEGDDQLYGEDGADSLNGGLGSDVLSGGLGADKFNFDANALIGGAIDTITDFSGKTGQGDKISLAAIDADGVGGASNGKFAFIGTGAFTGAVAQVRYFTLLGDTVIQADINGDRVADLTIILTGGHALQVADFVL